MAPDNLKKGGTPPAEDAADANSSGLGMMHGKANDGRPDTNTANKKNTVGSGGTLPGSMAKADETAMAMFKMASPVERMALLKSAFGMDAPQASLQKSADEPVTHGDLRKMFGDLRQEIVGELRKSAVPDQGPELQKSGLTPLQTGDAAPKPELVKMEQEPSYGNRQDGDPSSGSELQKGEMDWSTPVQIANKGGVMTPGRVPTMAELAKIPMGEF